MTFDSPTVVRRASILDLRYVRARGASPGLQVLEQQDELHATAIQAPLDRLGRDTEDLRSLAVGQSLDAYQAEHLALVFAEAVQARRGFAARPR